MPPGIPVTPLAIAALVVGALGALFLLGAIIALFRARALGFAMRLLAATALLALGALFGAIAIGTQGYRALTREDLAARIVVQPTGAQRFSATVRFADGREASYELAGDEIYVDAHILKWRPLANVLGLHTAYELGRLAGRYRELGEERRAPRTVYSLGTERPLDLFSLRQRHAFLAPLVDAQYGSATFVPVTERAELEVRVSTTGLLMRDIGAAK
ncbi:MAG: hypothetical protein E6H54_14170 [Betaproteobacteria bacterium]|nr:MAG: hypothetical protein E6H54_14170 [Betaproteobacteria bacterium]